MYLRLFTGESTGNRLKECEGYKPFKVTKPPEETIASFSFFKSSKVNGCYIISDEGEMIYCRKFDTVFNVEGGDVIKINFERT